ncbi:hypothetical protein PPL_02944 [Heterostelium album PN500]|uniref:B30.2/SPRY domain-containing protein n=1 Tax=Heterostelium pallidum (strain ATCC 26659 / Pp 5 / PN500) TaxID=670386 RepID=D3B3H6_HETP5|nr:hypothetical protein PPL_02944 [Heterostelium album PN500]EFA83874.1 hypothetical protein PPL_02944 [Heterostelium album PN500]|eukprot:XP_020435991.1 hypothetical protein PPL_02944 [Heterostelium album PN500]
MNENEQYNNNNNNNMQGGVADEDDEDVNIEDDDYVLVAAAAAAQQQQQQQRNTMQDDTEENNPYSTMSFSSTSNTPSILNSFENSYKNELYYSPSLSNTDIMNNNNNNDNNNNNSNIKTNNNNNNNNNNSNTISSDNNHNNNNNGHVDIGGGNNNNNGDDINNQSTSGRYRLLYSDNNIDNNDNIYHQYSATSSSSIYSVESSTTTSSSSSNIKNNNDMNIDIGYLSVQQQDQQQQQQQPSSSSSHRNKLIEYEEEEEEEFTVVKPRTITRDELYSSPSPPRPTSSSISTNDTTSTSSSSNTKNKKKSSPKFNLKKSPSLDNSNLNTLHSQTLTTPTPSTTDSNIETADKQQQQQPPPPPPQTQVILKLPYDLNSLHWDLDHLSNEEAIYCYCGKDLDKKMVRCDLCLQIFHFDCVKLLEGSDQIIGDWVYRFSCSVCTKGRESFERFAKNWVDVLEIVLYNLALSHPNRAYFHLDDEIIPMIDQNWHLLCSDKKINWFKQLQPALTNGHIFKQGDINIGKPGYWALGTLQLVLKDNPTFKDKVLAPINKKKKRKSSSSQEKRFKHLTKLLLIPLKESNFVPTIEYDRLCVAIQNSAPQIVIEENGMVAKSLKGYRMAKASFPCITGSWYFEIEVVGNAGSSRLGWSTFRGDKQANVGYDQFSYGYRSQQGDIFHCAKSKPYGESYAVGDVLGFYIHLPLKNAPFEVFDNKVDPLKIYEMISDELDTEQPETVEGSEIRFFKNGRSPGVAFTNIGRGMYYPAASMYMGASVRFNFGPTFKFPPQGLTTPFRPFCETVKLTPNSNTTIITSNLNDNLHHQNDDDDDMMISD